MLLLFFLTDCVCWVIQYELGSWSHARPLKPLLVGTHPDYARSLDVEIQTKIARPHIKIVHSLEDLLLQIEEWIHNFQRKEDSETAATGPSATKPSEITHS